MKKYLLFVTGILLYAFANQSKPVLALAPSNNPLVESIILTFNSRLPIPKKIIVNTYSAEANANVETGNLDTNSQLEIKSLGILEKIKQGNTLNNELLVGSGEVLTNTINGARVIYAHNGLDKFGQLYKLAIGEKISLTTENELFEYILKEKSLVDTNRLSQVKAKKDTIYLVTCSYGQPNLRYLLRFEK